MVKRILQSSNNAIAMLILNHMFPCLAPLIIRFVFLCLLSYFQTTLLAQNPNRAIDSLLTLLKTAKEDTFKVNNLNKLTWRYIKTGSYEKALPFVNAALSLAEKLNFKVGVIRSYSYIGIIHQQQGHYPEALENHLAALKIKEEIGDKLGLSYSYYNFGVLYERQGNYPEALKNFQTALKIYEDFGDKEGVADSYGCVGNIYFFQSNYQEAIKNYLTSLKIYEEIGDGEGVAIANGNLAMIYSNQGNYPQALKNLLSALKYFQSIKANRHIAASYSNIGTIYQTQGNYPEALKNYLASLDIQREMGNKEGIASLCSSIGNNYSYEGNYPEALKNYLLALQIQEEIGDKQGLAKSYNNIGIMYANQSNYAEALKNYSKAVNINEEIGHSEGLAFSYINIGNVYTDQAAVENSPAAQLKHREAIEYLQKGLSLAQEIGIKSMIKDGYQGLAEAYEGLNDYQNAFEYTNLYIELKDSLLNNESTKKLEQLRTQFEVDKAVSEEKAQQEILISKQKFLNENELAEENARHELVLTGERAQQEKTLAVEKVRYEYAITEERTEKERKQDQLTLLNKESEIQRLEIKKQKLLKNYFLGGLLLLGLLSFFIYSYYITRQKLKLQTLRNKIASDLHDDVGSTLSSIYMFSEMAREQSKEVIPLLNTIGESSRKMLDAMADIVWTINPENDQFEKIILRMRNFAFELLGARKINFEFIANDEVSKIKLPMDVRKNLYLIFKEATNNIMKYAEADRALISLKHENDQLTMLVRDNGKGFDPNKSTEGNGIKNMKKRAKEMGAKLDIESNVGMGTTIQLKIAI